MSFNKKEILSLSAEEKVALAEELWSSVEKEILPASDDEIAFAKERFELHEANVEIGVTLEDLKKYFNDKYGF